MGCKIFTGICRWHAFRVSVGTMLLVILLLSSGAGAIPAEEWNMTFGGANYDYAKFVQQTQKRIQKILQDLVLFMR